MHSQNASESSLCGSTVTPCDSPNNAPLQWVQAENYLENPDIFTKREHLSPRQTVQPMPLGTPPGNAFNQQCPYYYSFDSAASTDGIFVKKEHGTFTQKHEQLIHPRQCSPLPSKGAAFVGDCSHFESQSFQNQASTMRRSAQAYPQRFMRPYLHTDNFSSPKLPYVGGLQPGNYATHQFQPKLYFSNQTLEASSIGVKKPNNLHQTFYHTEAEEQQQSYRRSPCSFQVGGIKKFFEQ